MNLDVETTRSVAPVQAERPQSVSASSVTSSASSAWSSKSGYWGGDSLWRATIRGYRAPGFQRVAGASELDAEVPLVAEVEEEQELLAGGGLADGQTSGGSGWPIPEQARLGVQGVFGCFVPGLAAQEEGPLVRVIELERLRDHLTQVGQGAVLGEVVRRRAVRRAYAAAAVPGGPGQGPPDGSLALLRWRAGLDWSVEPVEGSLLPIEPF